MWNLNQKLFSFLFNSGTALKRLAFLQGSVLSISKGCCHGSKRIQTLKPLLEGFSRSFHVVKAQISLNL